jgi:excisionase family DNA binding protein
VTDIEILNIKLYDLKETAQVLGVTERTVMNYLKAGKLKGQKIRKKWQITEQNLEKFIKGDSLLP